MTEQDKFELSKRVAKLYGIKAVSDETEYRLAYDSARCFELAVEHGVHIKNYYLCVECTCGNALEDFERENYLDHPTKAEATRIAILKCLVKMKEGV